MTEVSNRGREEIVDKTTAMLRLTDPKWIDAFDPDDLRLYVAELIERGAAHASLEAERTQEEGLWSSGCIQVECDPVTMDVSVFVLAGTEQSDVEESVDA